MASGRGVRISPIPSASAVPPSTQKGTSAPTFAPILQSSSVEKSVSKSMFKARSAAAASVLRKRSIASTL